MRSKLLIASFFLALLVISVKPIFGKDYYKNISERENSDSISIDAIFALDSLYLSRKKTSPSVEDLLATKDVEIKIIPSSIKIKNSYLHLSYEVTNKTSKNLFIWSMNSLNIQEKRFVLDSLFRESYPRTYIQILDQDNIVPQYIIHQSIGHDWSEIYGQLSEEKDNMIRMPKHQAQISDSIQDQKQILKYEDKDRSVKLPSQSSLIYKDSIYIGNAHLKGLDYKLSLQYFLFRGNRYFEEMFKQKQKEQPELKGYELLKGMINSDTVAFQLPHPIIPKSLKYEDFSN